MFYDQSNIVWSACNYKSIAFLGRHLEFWISVHAVCPENPNGPWESELIREELTALYFTLGLPVSLPVSLDWELDQLK